MMTGILINAMVQTLMQLMYQKISSTSGLQEFHTVMHGASSAMTAVYTLINLSKIQGLNYRV